MVPSIVPSRHIQTPTLENRLVHAWAFPTV